MISDDTVFKFFFYYESTEANGPHGVAILAPVSWLGGFTYDNTDPGLLILQIVKHLYVYKTNKISFKPTRSNALY